MNYDEFIGSVRDRARLTSEDQALMATHATLQTLGERLEGGTPKKLASELPHEIGRFVLESIPDVTGRMESFDTNEFFRRVCRREGVEMVDAISHARAVLEVLGQAISSGEFQKLQLQLPAEWSPLFTQETWGRSPHRP